MSDYKNLFESDDVSFIINRAFHEDIGDGDITTDLLLDTPKEVEAYMITKEAGVIAGLPIAEKVFQTLDNRVEFVNLVEDGTEVPEGEKIASIRGSYKAILSGERLALNFLQRLSGIASMSRKFANVVDDLRTEILDTRKTTPGLRLLEKYAVAMGGATNHRMGLYDMVMIKDNHIQVAGGIIPAVNKVKASLKSGIIIEVETTNLEEVKEVLETDADIIMLDNMTVPQMQEAVELINGRLKVEASGNVNLNNVREIAETGVDYISVGALTHSVKSLDISQRILV